jgi:hypothetical protein
MAKIGRNDPCPCGSTKKYKNCCQNKEFVQTRPAESYANDPEWLKIRRTEGEVISRILEFAVSRYGKDFFEDALDEFGAWGEYEIDEMHTEAMFFPWVAFNWVPEFESEEPPEIEALPFGLEYLEENAEALNQYQQAFIREACSQPYSFFAITDVTAGESMAIRDIFLSRAFRVKESAASKTLKRGDIVFSRVVQLEGQAIMVGMAPTVLPARHQRFLLDTRDDLKKGLRKGGLELSQPLLLESDLDMRILYLESVEALFNPPKPELQNTDGHPLKFVKLYFRLDCSPREALDRLKSLTLPEFQDGILANEVFDADGHLIEATLDWQKRGNKSHKEWDNTVLANLRIKGEELTAEVNSEKRAEKIKSEIEKRLKGRAAFQDAVCESVETKMKEMENRRGSPGWELERAEMEEFQSRPEVRDLVKKQIEAHWESWYTQRIPALNNKTPLQAARTQSGRERLEALLLEFENAAARAPEGYQPVDIAAMRKRLGLTS